MCVSKDGFEKLEKKNLQSLESASFPCGRNQMSQAHKGSIIRSIFFQFVNGKNVVSNARLSIFPENRSLSHLRSESLYFPPSKKQKRLSLSSPIKYRAHFPHFEITLDCLQVQICANQHETIFSFSLSRKSVLSSIMFNLLSITDID